MLTVVSPAQSIQTTQGKYESVTIQLTSTVSLAGKVVKLTPSMFDGVYLPEDHSYQLVYPASGTVAMVKMNPRFNTRADVEYISDFVFKLHFYFFVGRNMNQYENYGFRSNVLHFSPVGAALGSVLLHLHVKVDSDGVTATIPAEINKFDNTEITFSFIANGASINGYDSDYDLDISFSFSGLRAAHNCYVGWFREDQITGSGALVQDLGLSYTQISDIPYEVDGLPYSVFTGGRGFLSFSTDKNARVTIGQIELEDGATYRAYIVYNTGGVWKSAISNQLKREHAVGVVDITPTFLITDALGNTTGDRCVMGLSSLVPVRIEATIPVASFGDAIVESTRVYEYTGVQDKGQFGSEVNAAITNDGTDITVTVDYKPAPNFQGLKNINIVVGVKVTTVVIIGDDTVSRADYIFNTTLAYSNSTVPINPTFEVGVTPVDFICSDGSGDLDIETGLTGILLPFISYGNGAYSENQHISVIGSEVTIAREGLSDGSCLKVVNKGIPTEFNPCADRVILNQLTVWDFYVGFNTVWEITFTVGGGASQVVTGSGTKLIVSSEETVAVISFTFTSDSAFANPTHGVNQLFFDIDCPDPVTCDNSTSINYTCDEDTHTITITPIDTIVGDLISTTYTATFGGTTIAAPETIVGEDEVYVFRKLEFSDCDPIEITERIVCYKASNCSNTRIVTYALAGLQLTVDFNDTFASTIEVDSREITLDGGITWNPYTGPLTVAVDDDIIIRHTVTFIEDCPDISGTINVVLEATVCDYTGLGLDVAFDIATDKFVATNVNTVAGTDIDEILYTVNGSDPIVYGTIYTVPVYGQEIFTAVRRVRIIGCSTVYFIGSAYRPTNNARYKEVFIGDNVSVSFQLTKNGGFIHNDDENSYDINMGGALIGGGGEITYTVSPTGLVSIFVDAAPYALTTDQTLIVVWWW